jgi:protein-tyrosine phosphatase
MSETFAIATLPLDGGGRLGICPLPGGDGGLAADVAAIAAWQPSLVVSLTEQAEMERCGSGRLGAVLGDAAIAWSHLPIRDFSGPDGAGRAAWPDLAARLHAILDHGGGVLLHCRGGRGRSGMIAMRLLVERGEAPAEALARLRAVRPGAVETEAQLDWAAAPLR